MLERSIREGERDVTVCALCARKGFENPIGTDGICAECRQQHALADPPGVPLRPPIPCVRCHGRSFVRVLSIRERATTAGEHPTTDLAPLGATYELEVSETFFTNRTVKRPLLSKPLGVFEAYVCRACGYTDLYARDPASIPIGREYNTELVELPEAPPYR
jgi:hypothetical protein